MYYRCAIKTLVFAALCSLTPATSTHAQSCTGWVNRTPSTNNPPVREFHTMAFDTMRSKTVLFGGTPNQGATLFGDTWEWDGATWENRATTGPTGRNVSAMAYDTVRHVTVLFGGFSWGFSGTAFLGDTWEWDGTVWTLRSNAGPPPRGNHSLVYDHQRHVAVMFGGTKSGGQAGDTWEWDGSMWTQRANSGPAPRTNRAMSFDNSRGTCLLYGGTPDFASYLNDTWEWNQPNWIQRFPPNSPSPRYRHASAFDFRRNVTVFFGGGQGEVYNNETWEWDGADWTQRTDLAIPALGGHAMAYDSARNTVIVFGGIDNAGQSSGQIWELDLSATPTAITHPNSPSLCAGGSVTLKSTFDGPGAFTYRWRKDGQWLTDDAHMIGADTNTLVFLNAAASDAGTYECRAVNACAQAFCKPATLTVFPTGTADLNSDKTVNALDIAPFVAALINHEPVSTALCAADLTGEGIVSDADIPPFVTRVLGE